MSLYGFPNNKVDLWILAGQSNMDGAAQPEEFPAAYTGFQYGPLYRRSSTEADNLVYPGTLWGPRYILIKELANYKSKHIMHVNAAVSGSPLGFDVTEDWNILSLASNGSAKPIEDRLLDSMTARVAEAIVGLANKGLDYTLKGFLWCQGEHDSGVEAFANAYAQNFKDMRNYVRGHFSLPNLPFVIWRTHNNFDPPRAYNNIVRQAQFDNSNQSSNPTFYDANTYIIDTDGYSLQDDLVHYDAAGVAQMCADGLAVIKNL